MRKTEDEWIAAYKKKDALWIHSGDPQQPHARLTSGKHSNGFFNSRLVIPDIQLMRDAAAGLFELFTLQGGRDLKTEGIVGPQTGATRLAEYIKDYICMSTLEDCFWASPAKSEQDGKKSMVFSSEELALLPGKNVVLCEDVITTGGSIELTENAILDAGGRVLPFVLVLVNRSGLETLNGKRLISLISHPMPTWDVDNGEECPLCAQGSEAIRPKGPEEWARLTTVV